MITLLGNPLSTNSIYKSVCMGKFPRVYMSHTGKALKESYQLQAMSQWKQGVLTCNLKLEVSLFFDTKGKHDIDNYGKLLYDSLQGIVYFDDSQIQEAHVKKFIDVENPRIEVTVGVL